MPAGRESVRRGVCAVAFAAVGGCVHAPALTVLNETGAVVFGMAQVPIEHGALFAAPRAESQRFEFMLRPGTGDHFACAWAPGKNGVRWPRNAMYIALSMPDRTWLVGEVGDPAESRTIRIREGEGRAYRVVLEPGGREVDLVRLSESAMMDELGVWETGW